MHSAVSAVSSFFFFILFLFMARMPHPHDLFPCYGSPLFPLCILAHMSVIAWPDGRLTDLIHSVKEKKYDYFVIYRKILSFFLCSPREKDEIMQSLSYNMVIWAYLPASCLFLRKNRVICRVFLKDIK